MNTFSSMKSWQLNGEMKSQPIKSGAIRYLDVGRGQPLLLIHTLRTQLDYFQKLVPLLKDRYRILAIDLPGHGYSSIPPRACFDEPFFRRSVIEFIENLDLGNLIVVGESIGGVLSLGLAAVIPERISCIFALNPYDYGESFGGGIRRSRYGYIIGLFALFGRFTLEPSFALKWVLSGGLADPVNLPQSLFMELVQAGRQKGYRQAEYLLYKHWRSWLKAKNLYPKIEVPAMLIYGEQDWSTPQEREDRRKLIPGVKFTVLPAAGHFSALEVATQLAEIVNANVVPP